MDKNINYIVSGLERSGTSLMMQILEKAGIPIVYDDTRLPDDNNPNGYYELFGGNIIGKLMNNEVDMNKYKGKFIKITSYGLKYLPRDFKYKVIIMDRNIDEIIESGKKMGDDKTNRETLKSLIDYTYDLVATKDWFDGYCYISYNDLLDNPDKELDFLKYFLDVDFDNEDVKTVIDKKLYRNRIKG